MKNLNLEEYRDKVLGCWTGKSIGGTLGAPFEWTSTTNEAEFYVQKLTGQAVPNDDLDLQLVWLQAAEEQGVHNLTPRLLGEYWFAHITGPWNEYSVCRANIGNGLRPPLSGSCNNEIWKWSNGAWIRSEIWACIFPGNPDEAVKYAWMDASLDHCGEGVYAELFTAALESAAFIESDIRNLIKIGLSKIPYDCRIARAVRLACAQYDAGCDFNSVREALVKDSADLGWFRAPANIGFVITGLLFGEGDFGRTICRAVNCGDDADCTGATTGAIMGIRSGRKAIPGRWIEPIGESIKTFAIDETELQVPKTLDELTRRVMNLATEEQAHNPLLLLRLSEAATQIPPEYREEIVSDTFVSREIWTLSPYALTFDLSWGELTIDYENGPAVTPGIPKKLAIILRNCIFIEQTVRLRWNLPEAWTVQPFPETVCMAKHYYETRCSVTIIPGEFTNSAYEYIPLEIRLSGRHAPELLSVPFQREGALNYNEMAFYPEFNRNIRRMNETRKRCTVFKENAQPEKADISS